MLAAGDRQFIFLSFFKLLADLRIHVEFLFIFPSIFGSTSSKIIQSYKYKFFK